MKAFRCGDVVPGCRHEFLGADREAVLGQVVEHARHEHHDLLGDPTAREALAEAVGVHLREVHPHEVHPHEVRPRERD